MPKINSIGVTRLFSTGRFEHTKISINMEPGEKPGTMLQELQGLIEDLNPSCPVEDYEYQNALEVLAKPDDESGSPYAWTHEKAQALIDRCNEWTAKRQAAYARLDELGVSIAIEATDNTPID